jgi:hypothetical protein
MSLTSRHSQWLVIETLLFLFEVISALTEASGESDSVDEDGGGIILDQDVVMQGTSLARPSELVWTPQLHPTTRTFGPCGLCLRFSFSFDKKSTQQRNETQQHTRTNISLNSGPGVQQSEASQRLSPVSSIGRA